MSEGEYFCEVCSTNHPATRIHGVRERKKPTPPIAQLAASNGKWKLSIVLYPSGPCLELVDESGEFSHIAYSERIDNINLATKVLKRRNPDA